MPKLKKFFDWALRIVGAIALLVILFIGSISVLSRQERALAKEFLQLVGEKDFEKAHEMLADTSKRQYPLVKMQAELQNLKAYTVSKFTNVNINTSTKVWSLTAQATTQDNCTSKIYFEIQLDKILVFNVTPGCILPDRST
ncbi:hypothetical protein [Pseudophaeobacter sp.]|uniref:hypothetical protein n=1 Tax=Pseudophaeobacter sp. TaxID=1971739 RepID=UPI00405A24F5